MNDDRYVLVTPPAELPVSLAEVKAWLKISHTSDDAVITTLLNAAVEKAELFTNRVFVERTFTGYFAGLECSCCEIGYFISLRRAPLLSVTSVEVTVDDAQVVIDTDEYNVKDQNTFARIIFSEVSDSPDNIPEPYQVDFTAGYGEASDVPYPLKVAIMNMVAYWYQNRGDCGAGMEIPGTAKGILREYRIVNTFGC